MKLFEDKKTIGIIFYFLLTNSIFCYSQNYIKLSGKITDNETGQPVPFASISLKGQAIGTIANISGDFVFNLSNEFKSDTIFITAIGYDTYKNCIAILMANNNYKIKLISHLYNLKELSIKDKNYTVRQILKKVRSNYKKNYRSTPYIADSYYREYTKEDSLFVRAIEIAMSIYNDGSAKSKWNYPTILNGLRYSNDYSDKKKLIFSDYYHLTIFFKQNWTILGMLSNFKDAKVMIIDTMKYFNGHYVYVIKIVNKIVIKEKIPYNYISKRGNDNNDEDIFKMEDDSIDDQKYDIEYTVNLNSKIQNQKLISEILSTDSYDYSEFYIDEKDFSVVYFKYFFKIPYHFHGDKENDCLSELGISSIFEKYNNTLYPKLMNQYECFVYKEKEGDSIKYISKKTYILASVNKLNFTNVKPFNDEDLLKDRDHFKYLSQIKSDTSFWQNYNYFPDDNLRKKVFNDLEYLEKNKINE